MAWSEKDKLFVRMNSSMYTIDELIIRLGKSDHAIRRYLQRHNLDYKRLPHPALSYGPDAINEVVQLAENSKLTYKKISELTGICPSYVRLIVLGKARNADTKLRPTVSTTETQPDNYHLSLVASVFS